MRQSSQKNLATLLDVKIRSFVFPFIVKNHSPELLDLAEEYYTSSRITTEGFAFNKFPLRSRYSITGTAVTTDNPIDEYNKLVDIVSLKDLWLIEVFHLVSDKNTKSAHRDEPYRFFTHINTFREHIRYILSKNIPIKTQGQVIAGLAA